jgi:hypothetical protein
MISAANSSNYDQWLATIPGSEKVKCLVCAKEFTQRWNARSHYKQFHSGIKEKPAPCHICGKLFKGRRNRNEHLRSVHGITQAMMRGLSF